MLIAKHKKLCFCNIQKMAWMKKWKNAIIFFLWPDLRSILEATSLLVNLFHRHCSCSGLFFCFVSFLRITDSSSMPVFQMFYERNPARCRYDRRLEVNTSPLNIVYNPLAMKKVSEFFYKGRVHTSGKSKHALPFWKPTYNWLADGEIKLVYVNSYSLFF